MLAKFWATAGVQMTSRCQKSEFGAENWHQRPFDSPEGRPTAPREHGRGRNGRTCCQKWALEARRLVTLGGPGRYKCPVYKENVCFLERPDGEQLSMQGCMIARKVVVFNLNEKTCMICMVLGGAGEALGGPIRFYTANEAPAEGQN
jgi:hypothetical protein